MFKNEFAVLQALIGASRDASIEADRLESLLDEFCARQNMLRPANDPVYEDALDHAISGLDGAARDLDVSLAKFDKMLNKIIAERVKLGGFEITCK
jgi:hypothetical protein